DAVDRRADRALVFAAAWAPRGSVSLGQSSTLRRILDASAQGSKPRIVGVAGIVRRSEGWTTGWQIE
ncbi:MAG: hypothetical protein WCE79_03415, partial [Xanthobacteraceae bacterium]